MLFMIFSRKKLPTFGRDRKWNREGGRRKEREREKESWQLFLLLLIPFSLCLKSHFPFLRLFSNAKKMQLFLFLSFSAPELYLFSRSFYCHIRILTRRKKRFIPIHHGLHISFWVQMINKMKESFWNTRPKSVKKFFKKWGRKYFSYSPFPSLSSLTP